MNRISQLAAIFAIAIGTVVPAAAESNDPSALVRDYLDVTARDLPPQVQAALQLIDGTARQLLAARSYLRAEPHLAERWSWSADEIRAYESSAEYRELLAQIARVRARFEAANPGYSLYANTKPRSLDLQLQRWNSNASVGVVAANLHAAAARELSRGRYIAQPDPQAARRFAEFLRNWRPVPAAPLAAPGLSPHGRSRAIDFQIITRGGQIVAPTEIAKVHSVWERQGWVQRLAAALHDSDFIGPLRSPNEPWHYEYAR